MTAIPADFDPMLELARARLAAYPNHGPWEGTNHALCPICHAQDQIHIAGLAMFRVDRVFWESALDAAQSDESEDEYLPGMAQRIAQGLAGVVRGQ